jgi:hypothetical protein
MRNVVRSYALGHHPRLGPVKQDEFQCVAANQPLKMASDRDGWEGAILTADTRVFSFKRLDGLLIAIVQIPHSKLEVLVAVVCRTRRQQPGSPALLPEAQPCPTARCTSEGASTRGGG